MSCMVYMHAYAISFKFQLPSENEDKRKVNFSETFFFNFLKQEKYRQEREAEHTIGHLLASDFFNPVKITPVFS